ncbi:type II toxin-antitoxin system PemK/MazF family toxin [Eoetvoesiella caeni]|uniref:mRNA interferase MazF n=1 Tax=Eoetvoesiella caeni TaxID=645616 RepID=A0A366H7Y0_9BURK|nr:type II toxin-antitoxin system PemK/MazF family toxin [Eoetvoesiella caeni]MCI2809850.1 type II toxin-antitoxin system PemK/MazF family toxin [Eoetvoesiella caeni]NYT56233.1 type II toxin-antitoxin system PemK/MazF family toxin [Eoetvoesiella caeni]RBP38291.1 mRNA interferase MazF [Eoetvoesiella caeni]
MIHRGDFVVVSLQGNYGKPRPALVIQSDLLAELDSVMICPVTSETRDAMFRVVVEPDTLNGLQALSQVMVDKVATLPRSKVGAAFGRLDADKMRAVERALLVVTGIA